MKPFTMTDRITKLTENCVALSDVIHGDKRYADAYVQVADQLSGFPGIWNYLAEVAVEITNRELAGTVDFSEKIDWITFMQDLGSMLVGEMTRGRVPKGADLSGFIDSAVHRQSEEFKKEEAARKQRYYKARHDEMFDKPRRKR